jgi:hypothetical protein
VLRDGAAVVILPWKVRSDCHVPVTRTTESAKATALRWGVAFVSLRLHQEPGRKHLLSPSRLAPANGKAAGGAILFGSTAFTFVRHKCPRSPI